MGGRIDVPEIEDSRRCPALLRDAMTAYLQVGGRGGA
jgi:hypothetical protein